MAAYHIENRGNSEFEQIYEEHIVREGKCNDDVKDKAYSKIFEEDLFFVNNKQKLNPKV